MQLNPLSIQAYSLNDFCRLYGIGRTKAYDEISNGRLRTKKVGRRTLILKSDIEAWASKLPAGGPVHVA